MRGNFIPDFSPSKFAEGRKGEAVADPYYGDEASFEVAWSDVTLGAQGLARRIAQER